MIAGLVGLFGYVLLAEFLRGIIGLAVRDYRHFGRLEAPSAIVVILAFMFVLLYAVPLFLWEELP